MAADYLQTVRAYYEDLLRLSEGFVTLRREREIATSAAHIGQAVDLTVAVLLREFPNIGLEVALDRLIAAADWEHPSEILGVRSPPYADLLRLCRKRIRALRGPRPPHLVEVRRKLAKATRIERLAQRERERRRQGDATPQTDHQLREAT